MSEVTLTSKGRITIPADIRRALGVSAHDRITFTLMRDGTVVLRAKNKSVQRLKGMLKPQRGASLAVEDMSLGNP
ncbi:AbrB/MazE/SpoVT family DNA-binding domain-containing protein [Thauera sp. Sel9]|uniref:AbrB/MazE/SpoVT family DNA-binding domain-containing protein n=1 Tax=Thauera sp. Sel9 TaxID=2974299 RepID=UPI0021E13533|nr:type II toxin-antitoxin system PrlF family antitoxin [Thauera sp. Sel9]MCV2219382.1 type II toxin-antitoxin system PrlF family antitoxin [Thauera sp. Sel9]